MQQFLSQKIPKVNKMKATDWFLPTHTNKLLFRSHAKAVDVKSFFVLPALWVAPFFLK